MSMICFLLSSSKQESQPNSLQEKHLVVKIFYGTSPPKNIFSIYSEGCKQRRVVEGFCGGFFIGVLKYQKCTGVIYNTHTSVHVI